VSLLAYLKLYLSVPFVRTRLKDKPGLDKKLTFLWTMIVRLLALNQAYDKRTLS